MEEQEKDTKEETKTEDKNNVHFAGFQVEDGSKMKACKYCRVMVPKKAWICPNCKMKIRRHWGRLIAALLFVAVIGGSAAYLALTENGNAMMVSAGLIAGKDSTVAENETAGNEKAQTSENGQNVVQQTEDVAKAEPSADAIDIVKLASDLKTETSKADTKSKDQTAEPDKSDATSEENVEEDVIEEALSIAKTDSDTAATQNDQTDAAADQNAAGDAGEQSGTDGTEEDTAEQTIDPAAYSEEDFKGLCEAIDYRALMRTSGENIGRCLIMEAEILEQIDGGLFDEQVYYLVAQEDAKGILRYYILRDDRGEDAEPLFEGDSILVYGQMFATCKPKGSDLVMNHEIPAVAMVYAELQENT